jgi:hypothetical protein
MAEIDTRARILDAAETLFAAQGFEATILRQLTGADAPHIAAEGTLDEGDGEAPYARPVSVVLGGLRAPLAPHSARSAKPPRMRKAA